MSGRCEQLARGGMRALLPVAAGHALAVALGLGGAMAGLSVDRRILAALAGVLLIWMVLAHLSSGGARARLAVCSFMLSTAHGAGMMLIPMLGPVCAGSFDTLGLVLASVALHTAGMVAMSGLLAGAICRGLAALGGALRAAPKRSITV